VMYLIELRGFKTGSRNVFLCAGGHTWLRVHGGARICSQGVCLTSLQEYFQMQAVT
jgi:hypothetical protein